MSLALPFLFVLLGGAFVAYHRLRLPIWVAASAALLVACWLFGANHVAVGIAAVLLVLVSLPLLLPGVRKHWITAPLLGFYTRILPPLSDTERTALESGTVGFEGELFSGKPDWAQLLSQPSRRCRMKSRHFWMGPAKPFAG